MGSGPAGAADMPPPEGAMGATGAADGAAYICDPVSAAGVNVEAGWLYACADSKL
ncbi:hypothetical protein [Mycolicibacterium komossense]|uniref:hypothetical protein n=1 Tax=Mycolicibacterium komossense TaxID=1779 RepID=UPI0021F2FD43|nr:hypothetical protein [Mycolicibacterium komossense]